MRRMLIAGTLILAGILLILCGCSGNAGGVPDQQAKEMVEDFFADRDMQKEDYYKYSFTVEHHVDKRSHTDDAIIHLKIEYLYVYEETSLSVKYTYDRTKDLWSVSRKGNWSESVYQYIERELKGPWHIETYGNTYDIDIKGISGNTVDIKYSVSLEASAGLSGSVYFTHSGQEKLSIKGLEIRIPVKLDENFYCNQGGGKVTNETDVTILINPMQGCVFALAGGLISYVSPK